MLVADLEAVLEKLAPKALAEPGDNCGLLVGDRRAPVRRVLVALELTEPVLAEALAGGYDTVLTHHPLLFSPAAVAGRVPAARAPGAASGRRACQPDRLPHESGQRRAGLAAIAAEALGLQDVAPLRAQPPAGTSSWASSRRTPWRQWPRPSLRPEPGASATTRSVPLPRRGGDGSRRGPAPIPPSGSWRSRSARRRSVGRRWCRGAGWPAAIAAYVAAHPYEEPAFDIYPVEDVWAHAGLGRSGSVGASRSACLPLRREWRRLSSLGTCSWSGDGGADRAAGWGCSRAAGGA